MNRVVGKVALITGGGSGIGAATARIFCAEGGKVMLVDASQEGLADTQRDILERMPGAHVAILLADVGDAAKATHAVEETLAQFSRLDVLVNNASMRNYSAIADAEPAEWQATVGVNLIGPANFAKPIIPASSMCHRHTRSLAAKAWAFMTRPRPACLQ